MLQARQVEAQICIAGSGATIARVLQGIEPSTRRQRQHSDLVARAGHSTYRDLGVLDPEACSGETGATSTLSVETKLFGQSSLAWADRTVGVEVI